jgi:hypothetical protein
MLCKILVQTDGIILTGNSNLYGRDLVVLITKQTTLVRLTQHRFILIQLVRDLFYNKQWSGFTWKIKQYATVYQNFISCLYEAQHVSGDTLAIIRSLKLH